MMKRQDRRRPKSNACGSMGALLAPADSALSPAGSPNTKQLLDQRWPAHNWGLIQGPTAFVRAPKEFFILGHPIGL